MRRSFPLSILLATMLLAAAVAGCGGGDEGGSSSAASGGSSSASGGGSAESLPTSSLSQEEYVKRASAACAKRRGKLTGEMTAFLGGEQGVKEFTAGNLGAVFRQVIVPTFEDEEQIIRSLGAPDGDSEEIEAILASHAKAIQEMKKLKTPRSFEQIAKYFTATNKTMEEYGFTSCINN